MFTEFVVWTKSLITHFTYPALFFAGIISSSTIFLPLPVDALIFFAGSQGLNPLLIGIFTGIGAGIGEITGYLVGAGGHAVIKERKHKRKLPSRFKMLQNVMFETFVKILKKYLFFIVIIASLIPSLFDFVGIFSGAIRYDMKKFLIAAIIGKVFRYILIAYAGHLIIGWIGI